MTKPLISVVVTAHGNGHDLPCLVWSLENQRHCCDDPTRPFRRYVMGALVEQRPELIVTWDGKAPPMFNLNFPSHFAENVKLVQCKQEGGVGHHTRQPGIEAATGEWLVLTNADNYFVSGWQCRLLSHLGNNTGLVYWNCVHNIWQWQDRASTLQEGGIDLTCVAVRTEIAKEVGFSWRHYEGDSNYIQECLRKVRQADLNITHINETLCVHN